MASLRAALGPFTCRIWHACRMLRTTALKYKNVYTKKDQSFFL